MKKNKTTPAEIKPDWFKTLWVNEKMKYTGQQLRSLFAYMNYGVSGPSLVAFAGPCDVSLDHMKDGEDLRVQAKIASNEMLHFIFEVFDERLITGVFLQRLFASQVKDLLLQKSPIKNLDKKLIRSGDDLFYNDGKLSISIATRTSAGFMVHFAINITNKGTPVKTASLQDLKIDPKDFAKNLLELVKAEMDGIIYATYKVF